MKTIGIFLLLLLAATSYACTTFCSGPLFGKNYDWSIGNGLVIVNPRGLAKISASGHPAQWTSKYGSVTFNQFGREFPNGGMNEAGLVVELMWLEGTKYPAPDKRPTVGTLEWIQYQLDNSRSVEEVLQKAETIRIESDVPLHFLVGDARGNCTTVEFLNGQLVAHKGADFPVHALTNDTYDASLQAWKDKSAASSSVERFVTAGKMISASQKSNNVEYAFSVLDRVTQPNFTKWSIVYDRSKLRIYFKTEENRATRSFDFSDFDFSCSGSTKIVDINSADRGNIASRFVNYTPAANQNLVFTSYKKVPFLASVPETELQELARHGDAARCK